MISPKEFQKKIERSEEFKEYKKQNPDIILSDAFKIINEDWQLDYYSKIKDKIISFIIENKKIQKRESELFRKQKEEILPLNLNNIKISLQQALNKINQITKEKPTKTIVVLQTINKKQTWNITYITTSFKTLNIKINAMSGEIISKDESFLLNNLKLGDLIKKK